jgi:23S rRNA (guanosine2251-2'-O)-methyltransferase
MRIVPGIHSVEEVFKVRPKAITELWLREGDLYGELESFFKLAHQYKIKIKRSSIQGMDKIVHSHQGVLAHVNENPDWPSREELEGSKECLLFALDSLSDPQNLGGLMRSAWNFGARGVILTKDRSAGVTPGALKVASGAFEHIPTLEVPNLHSELKTLKELGFWVYGLDANASQDLVETDFGAKAVIVIGAEESGLRKPVTSACDAIVSIPQSPSSNSFNASVAGAIAGYEFLRQRKVSKIRKVSTEKI